MADPAAAAGHGESLVLAFTTIGVLGVGAQWLAWRMNLPAIVLMAIAGLLIGPVAGLISPELAFRPEERFGDFYQPMISVAVAVILFEGGLQLNFKDLKGLGKGILRLVILGAPIGWFLGSLAGHYIAGLSWATAIVFAGIMIVTGPTVIMPLLRQAKLSHRPAAVLKWEGIINDPIGALAAVIVFDFLYVSASGLHSEVEILSSLLISSILCTGWGVLIGYGLARAFREGIVPEYLKSPVLLAAVLVAFALANLVQKEGGLLAVTAMGVTMANTKMPSINQLRHFKENIAVLFVSGVFVILTANLTIDTLSKITWPVIGFVMAMLFIVRPVSVIISTMNTELTLQERLLVAWIAPRGIVAVAVSGLFAASMTEEAGFLNGDMLVPLAFAMVFATVLLHGFSISPLSKRLGLASTQAPGILMTGASPWSVELAKRLQELDVPVLLTDPDYRRLRSARQAGIPTYYGEILSEMTEHHVDLVRYGHLLAISGNESHNSLVCTDLAPEMDRAKTYQLSSSGKDSSRTTVSYTLKGRTFLSGDISLEDLVRLHWAGWTFQFTRLSEQFTAERYHDALPEEAMLIMVQRKSGLMFETVENPLTPQVGDRVLAFVPPDTILKTEPSSEVSEAVSEIETKKREAIDKIAP